MAAGAIVVAPGVLPGPGLAPALPAAPAVVPFPYRLLERGPGPAERDEALADVWRARGRPSVLGLAVAGRGAAGLLGVTLTAPSGNFAILAAVGLEERGGSLYGRLAVATGALSSARVAVPAGQWLTRDDSLATEAAINGTSGNLAEIFFTVRRASGETVTFTHRPSGSGDDTYFFVDGQTIRAGDAFPGPLVIKKTWPMPWRGEAGVQVLFQFRGGVATGEVFATVDPLREALRAVTLRIVDPRTLTSLPMTWEGAYYWASLGWWVRRTSWDDPAKMMRLEAGYGTTRAVLMIQSNSIVKRVARNIDLLPVDLLGADWVLVSAPEGVTELDLSAARLTLRAAAPWILFTGEASATTTPNPANPGDSPGHGGCDCCACPA